MVGCLDMAIGRLEEDKPVSAHLDLEIMEDQDLSVLPVSVIDHIGTKNVQ